MKKSYFILLFVAIGLIGCSSNSAAGKTRGKVDCYSIQVYEGGSTVFNKTYSAGYSQVFEYISSGGKKIYTSSHYTYYVPSSETLKDSVIRAYPSKYTNDYTEYYYSRFVGYLTKEQNYYLDIGSRMIDSETKWSEYKYTTDSNDDVNNKEALNCAKKGYYQDLTNIDNINVSLRLDLVESSLERHTYTMLGQDSVITYRAKWF